jgi:hypothetical protein
MTYLKLAASPALRVLSRGHEQGIRSVHNDNVMHADERDQPTALADDDAARGVGKHACPLAKNGEFARPVARQQLRERREVSDVVPREIAAHDRKLAACGRGLGDRVVDRDLW